MKVQHYQRPPRPSIAKAVAKRIVSATAPYAVNYLLPGAGNAIRYASAAARLANAGMKRWAKKYPPVKEKGERYRTRGRYAGKIKTKKKLVNSYRDVYASKGVSYTDEINGTVDDPDCVYIVHNAISSFNCVIYAVQSLIRKLFEKGGLVIASVEDILPNIAFDNSVNYKINLLGIQTDTGVVSVLSTYNTGTTDTVKSIAATFLTTIMTYSSGHTTIIGVGNSNNILELIKFELYNSDFNVTQGFQYKCALDLRDEHVHVKAVSDLKVQNRTLAFGGSSDSTDISNNPLQGRVYDFSGTPRTRLNVKLLEDVQVASGVQLIRGAEVGVNFKEPPIPKTFWNCKKSAPIRIQPGDIKKTTITYSESKPFLKWLRGLRLQYGTSTTFYEAMTTRPSQMIALEDVINVNASQKISVAYEVNRVTSVYTTTKKTRIIGQPLVATVQNNNTA